jgi:WD40-like Beta Propeller Repeat
MRIKGWETAPWTSVVLGLLLFTAACGGGGGISPSQVNPQPSITSLSPSGAPVGANSQALTINGTGFLATSSVTFNGISHTAELVSSQQLNISLSGTDLSNIGNFAVVVTNPAPGGGQSNVVSFRVQGGTLQIQITGLPVGTNANVSVTSSSGFSTTILSSQTLQLPPASYLVTANGVLVGSVNYYSTPGQQAVDIADGSSNSVQVPYNTIIPTTTKVLDQVGLETLVVSPDGSTLTMSSSSPVAQSLAPGDVLAIGVTAATPRGLLRQIVSVTQSGATIVATTIQGTLAEAFQQASFAFQSPLGPQSFQPAGILRPGVKVFRGTSPKSSAQILASSLTDPCAANTATFVQMIDVPVVQDASGALTATGGIEVCPSLQFNWSIGGFPPQLTSLTATVTLGTDAHVNVTGRFDSSFDQSVPIVTLETNDPITVFIGPVPIVVFPELTFFVGANGDVTVGFSTGVTQTATATAGISYDNGQLSPILTASSDFGTDPLGIDGGFSVHGFAGVTINLYIDAVLTPAFSPDGFLELDVNPTQNPWWTLTGGLEGSGSVKVSIFGFANLVDFEFPNLFQYPTPPKTIAQASGAFSTSSAAPALSSVSPNATATGSSDLTVNLTGSNFVPGAVANFNGIPLSTAFSSTLNLTAIIPASDLTTAGTFPLTVTNPDTPGATSAALDFTVIGSAGNPVPSITSLSPSSAAAGGPAFTLTVTGSNFISSSAVQWNGSGRTTTYVSSTELQAAITAADIAAPGTAQVTVVNPAPGGGTSNSATFLTAFPSGQKSGVVQTLSTSSSGTPGNGQSLNAALSSTGRYASFGSLATNLVTPNTVNIIETYWHDACVEAAGCTPQTQLASAISGTTSEGNNLSESIPTSITADGRFVGFSSSATNLVSPSTTQTDTYGRDTCSGAPAGCTPTTFLLSLTSTGAEPNGPSFSPILSANGRYAAFVSQGTDLVPSPSVPGEEQYLRDTCQTTTGPVSGCAPTTILVSANDGGNPANSPPTEADFAMSADGRFVAFVSSATNLVSGVTDGISHVYVRDTCVGAPAGCAPSTIVASAGNSGVAAVGERPSISGDGRFVAFTSTDALVPADTNGNEDVYLRDTCQSSSGPVSGCTPSTTLISVTPDGTAAGNASSGSSSYSLSSTGRFVAFDSSATNLTSGGTPTGTDQVFVHDTCFGGPAGCTPTTLVVSVDSTGNFVGNLVGVAIGADGHYVAFTEATDSQLVLALAGF